MTDEDQLGVERVALGLRLVLPDDLRTNGQSTCDRGPVLREAERGLVAIGGDTEEGDVLVIGAAVARGLQTVRLELRGDVLLGDLIAAGAGTASFEQVAGQELIVGGHGLPAQEGHAAGHGSRRGIGGCNRLAVHDL